jgi:4-carboxymuconolactone decarboxylase
MKSERYKKGNERLKDIGDTSPIENRLNEIAPDLNTYIREFAFGDVHSRPGLSKKEREIAIIASLTTLGHAAVELKSHINIALNVGCTREEVLEVIIQMAVYAGFPAAVNGTFVAKEVFDQRDKMNK